MSTKSRSTVAPSIGLPGSSYRRNAGGTETPSSRGLHGARLKGSTWPIHPALLISTSSRSHDRPPLDDGIRRRAMPPPAQAKCKGEKRDAEEEGVGEQPSGHPPGFVAHGRLERLDEDPPAR